ncbi:hypothetical protein [Delftia phage PhiW-14]|uniref:Uncharacterized protein n=1 Tax=Delftia phage PhiW-14 TaxID=665032 RepID=C9DG79_BPW14|nr:hypothetical protein DP-phiW-14_gp109 [Delftia phage PhiW-14]ACV50130.1 hypothetical protein [Delftia phage PhiW-14]
MKAPAHYNTIDNAIAAWNAGDQRKAISMVGRMKLTERSGLTAGEIKTLTVASNFMNGMGRMWAQMGWDEDETIAKAKGIFIHHFMAKQAKG